MLNSDGNQFGKYSKYVSVNWESIQLNPHKFLFQIRPNGNHYGNSRIYTDPDYLYAHWEKSYLKVEFLIVKS